MNSHHSSNIRNTLDLSTLIEERLGGKADIRDSGADPPAENINPRLDDRTPLHSEANVEAQGVSPRGAERHRPFETPRKVSTRVSTSPSPGVSRSSPGTVVGPRLLRDQRVVLDVVCCRLLSYTQLHTLVFPRKHRTAAGRRIRALEAEGWLRTWEERVALGGHPRYALPTKKALQWGLRVLLETPTNAPVSSLLATMLRDPAPTPLELEEGIIPKHLAHQRETNDVLIALRTSPLPIAWASSWHRPFPNQRDHLALPQPDAVVVIGDRLIFLEHDRGHEALDSFREAKAERYAALHANMRLLEALTGFRSFDVLVTIHAAAPFDRLQSLQQVTRATYGASTVRFTLYPWLLEAPQQAICFDAFTTVVTDDPLRTAHTHLVPILGVGRVPAGETLR